MLEAVRRPTSGPDPFLQSAISVPKAPGRAYAGQHCALNRNRFAIQDRPRVSIKLTPLTEIPGQHQSRDAETISRLPQMKLKVHVHNAEEGGFWAEIPALPGCVSEADTLDELMSNTEEAAVGWLEVSAERDPDPSPTQVVEIDV